MTYGKKALSLDQFIEKWFSRRQLRDKSISCWSLEFISEKQEMRADLGEMLKAAGLDALKLGSEAREQDGINGL